MTQDQAKEIDILEVTLSKEKQAEITKKVHDLVNDVQNIMPTHVEHPNVWRHIGKQYQKDDQLEELVFTLQKSIMFHQKTNKLGIVAECDLLEFKFDYLGECLKKLNRDDEALIAFEKSIELNKVNPRALHGIGLIYRDRKEFSKALGYYQKGLSCIEDIKVKEPFNYKNKLSRKERNFYQLATTTEYDLNQNASICCYFLKKYQEGLDYATKAVRHKDGVVEENIDNILPLIFVGRALLNLDEPIFAEGQYKKALRIVEKELKDDYEFYSFYVGADFYKTDRAEKALEFFDRSIEFSQEKNKLMKPPTIDEMSEYAQKSFVAGELIANKKFLKHTKRKYSQYKNLKTTLKAQDLIDLKLC